MVLNNLVLLELNSFKFKFKYCVVMFWIEIVNNKSLISYVLLKSENYEIFVIRLCMCLVVSKVGF